MEEEINGEGVQLEIAREKKFHNLHSSDFVFDNTKTHRASRPWRKAALGSRLLPPAAIHARCPNRQRPWHMGPMFHVCGEMQLVL